MKIFDAHFHIIDPRFPLIENQGYLPPEFKTEDYKSKWDNHELIGGAIVSGSFQGFDQRYLIDSLQDFGDSFFGVANIHPEIRDSEIEKLHKAGVRAVRFNLKRGGSAGIKDVNYLSHKLFAEYVWHSEFYIENKDLNGLNSLLREIPAFSIDHLGLTRDGIKDLYALVERGVKVKATGFGRVDFDPIEIMKTIQKINPEALLFGSDLPSTRAPKLFSFGDMDLIKDNFDEDDRRLIFSENALKWYKK